MANNNNFPGVAPSQQSGDQSYNSRQKEAEKSISEIIKDNEQKLHDIKISNLHKYIAESKELYDQLQKMNVDNAEYLNLERSRLEEKYANLLRKGTITQADFERKIQLELKDYARKLNTQEQQDLIKDNLRLRKLQKQEDLKSNKDLTKQIRKEKDKSRKEELKEELKKQKQHQKDILKDQKEQVKKARKEIMDNASSKQEGYKQRLEADLTDAGAQVMTKLNENINSLVNNFKTLFQNTIEKYGEYQSKINVRLQGLETT